MLYYLAILSTVPLTFTQLYPCVFKSNGGTCCSIQFYFVSEHYQLLLQWTSKVILTILEWSWSSVQLSNDEDFQNNLITKGNIKKYKHVLHIFRHISKRCFVTMHSGNWDLIRDLMEAIPQIIWLTLGEFIVLQDLTL